MRRCETCKRRYEQNARKQKYCSGRCRIKAWRKHKREAK